MIEVAILYPHYCNFITVERQCRTTYLILTKDDLLSIRSLRWTCRGCFDPGCFDMSQVVLGYLLAAQCIMFYQHKLCNEDTLPDTSGCLKILNISWNGWTIWLWVSQTLKSSYFEQKSSIKFIPGGGTKFGPWKTRRWPNPAESRWCWRRWQEVNISSLFVWLQAVALLWLSAWVRTFYQFFIRAESHKQVGLDGWAIYYISTHTDIANDKNIS